MKLLFDQNLSFRLVAKLEDVYPDSTHVRMVGLSEAPDLEVWNYASANGLTIVSKDDDSSRSAASSDLASSRQLLDFVDRRDFAKSVSRD